MFTVIVPAANEEKRIGKTISKLLHDLPNSFKILVISNGTDRTAGIVRGITVKNPRVKLIEFKGKIGKGGAIVEGLKAARGSVAFYDADGSAPPSELEKIERILRGKKSDIVLGSRWVKGATVGARPLKRKIASKLCTWLVKGLFGMKYSDTQCGCKGLSEKAREWAAGQNWRSKGFEWDVELLLNAERAGLKIVETPITWDEQPGGTAKDLDALRIAIGLVKLKVG